jgi:hypothetical protein
MAGKAKSASVDMPVQPGPQRLLSRVKKLKFISLRREEIQPGLEKNGTVRFHL